MMDKAERVGWPFVGGLVFILAIGGFLSVRAAHVVATWSPVQNQPAAAQPDPEHIHVTPDLDAAQLFREFQGYRHWGMTR